MTEIPTLVRNLRISGNGEFLVIDTQDKLSELAPDTGALTPLDSDVSAEGGFAWQGESLVFFDLYYHTLLKWNEQGEDEWLGDVTGQVDYYSSTIPSLTFGLSLEGYFLAEWYGETRDYTHLFTIDPNTLAQELRLVAKELYLYDLAFGPLPTP